MLHEQQDLVREVLVDALEDLAISQAIREGIATERVSREQAMEILEGRA